MISSSASARLRSKLAVFGRFMTDLASLSCCQRPDSKVAAVVVPMDLTEVIAVGYNGPAAGEDNMVCRGPAAVGSCGCIHAEANAVLKIKSRYEQLLVLATLTPCEHCAGLIINSRSVGYYLYGSEYRDLTGLTRIQNQGIVALSLAHVLGQSDGPSRASGQSETATDPPGRPTGHTDGWG